MQKIGRSGVELHEIKKHVTLDDETTLPSRPKSNYTPRKGGKSRNHPLGLFPGIGEFVPSSKRKFPKLTYPEVRVLLSVFYKQPLFQNVNLGPDDKLCKSLNKKEIIFWSTGRWMTTWKGDAIMKQVREGTPKILQEMEEKMKRR